MKTHLTTSLLAKPPPRNVNHGNDRFSKFNKERDISVKMLVGKAVAGDLRATRSLIALIEAAGNEETGNNSVLQDQELLDAFVEREIRRRTEFKGGNDAEQN